MVPNLNAAVEGPLDAAVVKVLCRFSGINLCYIFGQEGKPYLKQKSEGYNRASRHQPWLILVDLDQDFFCASELVRSWLPNKSPSLVFRVAVRSIEAWLLADRERFSGFFGVALTRIPLTPDSEPDPKQKVVNLASKSRKSDVRQDIVPRTGGSRKVGVAYNSRMIEYIEDQTNGWRPMEAAKHSDSLSRCLIRLREIR